MKNLFIAIAILATSVINAQEFNGVPIDGDLTTFVAKLKAKGFTLKEYIDNGAIIKGKVGTKDIDVYVFTTPKSKKVFKLSVYFPERSTWSFLKSEYEELVDIVTNKYGEPTSSYSSFKKPYYEGDGYEMSAVQLEKCNFASYWIKQNNLTLAVEISKWKQINITYENDKNMAIKKEEMNKIQTSTL
jgi:hypothetical protein